MAEIGLFGRFDELIQEFRKDTLMRYFDSSKPIFVFTDAQITGLGAMLIQGDDINQAKPVAFASSEVASVAFA